MKIFDKSEVQDLITRIKNELKKRKINRSPIKLTLKQNNIVKYINPKLSQTLQGTWNGYGYENLGKHLMCVDFIYTKKKLIKLKVKEFKLKKQVNPVSAWCNRLSKLTGLCLQECEHIARKKKSYKDEKITELEDRQMISFSVKRGKLINKMIRANPLRYIKDKEHAEAILIAHHRHENTNYHEALEDAKYQAMLGNIDKSEVRDYAKQQL